MLYVLDASSGSLVRNIKSNGAFGTPLIVDGIIYVGCFDKSFYAFTTEGKELWRYKHNSVIGVRRPSMHDDVIYGCCRDGSMYGLTTGGKLRIRYRTNELLWCTPATDGNSMYFGSGDCNFYSFDTATGGINWKFPTKGIIASTAAIDGDVLYFGGWDSHLYAITTSGELLWKFKLSMGTPAAIEPEDELSPKVQSQVVWRATESAEEAAMDKKGNNDINEYSEFSGTYMKSDTNYVSHGKKGYIK